MIPAAFDYRVPETVEEAIISLADNPGEGKLIAGGHSLLPMMKLRLAQPGVLVDLKLLREQLSRVWLDGDRLRIGALATHAHVASSTIVRQACPLLADTAAEIADIQVRNRGTIGGSIAHADPAADYPATLEALGALVTVQSASGTREEEFDSLLIDAFYTNLGEADLITEVSVPAYLPRTGGSYHKFANKASHFAIVGVASRVRLDAGGRIEHVTVGITGAGPRATRAGRVEDELQGKEPTGENIDAASVHAAEGIDCLSDLHGQADYREHLTRVLTGRAIRDAAARAAA